MFGISNNVKSRVVQICTPELLRHALDSPKVADVCAQIRDALEQSRRGEITTEEFETMKGNLKKELPILTPHATFKNGRRLNADAVPSGLSMYDLDHIPNPAGKWAEIESRKEELGIVMAHITPSTEGLRLIFILPPGMDLAQAQRWMAEQLGDRQYDVCVKDYARSSFVVPREYVLFLDEEGLFTPLPLVKGDKGGCSIGQGTLSATVIDDHANGTSPWPPSQGGTAGAASENTPVMPSENTPVMSSENIPVMSSENIPVMSSRTERSEVKDLNTSTNALQILPPFGRLNDKNNGLQNETDNEIKNNLCKSVESVVPPYPQTYEEIPYTLIVATLEEQLGGIPEHGSRNNFIYAMACNLRYVCNDEPDWVAQILPDYGEARDKWRSTIQSACMRSQSRNMPNVMKRVLDICRKENGNEAEETDEDGPPPMPARLPPLIKLLVSKTPKIYQPAVAHAVFPALATHLWKTTFRYIDNVEHEATLMNCLMAGTGAGKNCISEPINRIMADINRRDAENLAREKEWKNEMNTKGANKDKRKRPEGLVVQTIDPDMTNAAFVMRLSEAEERFLYTKMNEIDQFDALKTSARSKAHFQIMCLAFDPGNTYGQTRVGTQSISERVCIRFNWNASTTIKKGRSYFRSVVTDGPISRINFCTIPKRPIGSELPVYGSYDAKFDEELRPYIDNLNKARGLVECRQARTLAKKLMEENADFSRLSQSRVYENLSFRANVIAFLKAMVLYVAHGEKWDKSMEEFVRWSLKYDLWCKMHFFGSMIEDAEKRETADALPGPQNLLDLLPDLFTREEAARLRQTQGIDRGSLKLMLGNWKSRGYIEPLEDTPPQDLSRQLFRKTEEYLKRHN